MLGWRFFQVFLEVCLSIRLASLLFGDTVLAYFFAEFCLRFAFALETLDPPAVMGVVLDVASSESSIFTVRCLKARAPSSLTLLKPKAGHVWWGPFSGIYEGVNALFLGVGSLVDSLVAALFDSSFWLDACSPSCVSKVTGARW